MPDYPVPFTLALVLTAAGATASAALVTGLVQLLKSVVPLARDRERLIAFILSAVIVVVAYAQGISDKTIELNIASGFAAFLAWYGIARISMAVYDDVSGTKTPGSLRT